MIRIFRDNNNPEKQKIQLSHTFKSPESLDEYVERNKRIDWNKAVFDDELYFLEKRLEKPINKSYTKKSWEIFSGILSRIYHAKLFIHYRDRLFLISQKIVFKDYIAGNKPGSYKHFDK